MSTPPNTRFDEIGPELNLSEVIQLLQEELEEHNELTMEDDAMLEFKVSFSGSWFITLSTASRPQETLAGGEV